MTKTNSYFDLAGPGARAYVHGFMFGDQRQHFDLHTLQRHLRRADHQRPVHQERAQGPGAQRLPGA